MKELIVLLFFFIVIQSINLFSKLSPENIKMIQKNSLMFLLLGSVLIILYISYVNQINITHNLKEMYRNIEVISKTSNSYPLVGAKAPF